MSYRVGLLLCILLFSVTAGQVDADTKAPGTGSGGTTVPGTTPPVTQPPAQLPPVPPPPVAGGQTTLYGIDYYTREIVTISTTTGKGTRVATMSLQSGPIGLAYRGNVLYTSMGGSQVFQVDPGTGKIVKTVDVGNALGGEGDMTFRQDGMGFAVGGIATADLVQFDVTKATAKIVGKVTPGMDALVFSAAGELYGLRHSNSNKLYKINPTTGATTFVADVSGVPTGGAGVSGLAFDARGTLYVCFGATGGSPKSKSYLGTLDPKTGKATIIGDIGFPQISGISFGPPVPPPAAPGVLVSGNVKVGEGGQPGLCTVALSAAPTTFVTITLKPDSQLKVGSPTLSFNPANWQAPQTVAVSANDDSKVEGAHTGMIALSAASSDPAYNGIKIASVTVSITDNDSAVPPPPAPPLPPTTQPPPAPPAPKPAPPPVPPTSQIRPAIVKSGGEGSFLLATLTPARLVGPFTVDEQGKLTSLSATQLATPPGGNVLVLPNTPSRSGSAAAPAESQSGLASALAALLGALALGSTWVLLRSLR